MKLTSSTSNAEVKNASKYTVTLPYDLTAWCLVKNREKFTFYKPEVLVQTSEHQWV